jgi:hypothetical protein
MGEVLSSVSAFMNLATWISIEFFRSNVSGFHFAGISEAGRTGCSELSYFRFMVCTLV